MNKNILISSFIALLIIFSPINSSDLEHHLAIINSNSNQVAAALHRAKDLSHNEKILNGTAPLDKEFQIALVSGRYDYLRSMPNKKNWFSNMFKSKNTSYVNEFINQEIDPNTRDRPLQLAVKIAGYHRAKAITANAHNNNSQFNESIFKLHQMQQTILFLIDNGANINAQNRKGQTALHLAYENAEFQTARILLNANADPMMEDNAGKKAFKYLDKSKVKSEQEYKNLKKDYYDAYDSWDKKSIKESHKKLSKLKIVPTQELIIDNNVRAIERKSSPTTTEIASSTTSSDRTSSERSSNKSTQRGKRTKAQPITLSSPASLAPLKLKPRRSSAGSLGIIQKPTASLNLGQDTLIIDTIEFNQQIKETKISIKPRARKSKALQNQPTEYLGASHARGPAQNYMESKQPQRKSSTVRKKSTSKVYIK